LTVEYELACANGEDPFALAREIAVEQTAEVPEDCIPADLNERIVGHIEGMEHLESGRWRAVVSYRRAAIGPGVPQLLTILYGNISMKSHVRITDVRWPSWLLEALPGPAFGISGVRELVGVPSRPMVCGALKPMGLPVDELARRAEAFARGGIDLVKDDHGLHDQAAAPFSTRVARCQEAIERGRQAAGTRTLYLPNLGGPIDSLPARVETLERLGVRGAFVAPIVLGLDTLRWLAETSGLVLLAHPALSGVFIHPDHGIAAEILYGDLMRLLGADGVIYPNAGGRFPFSEALCQAINRRLRRRLGAIRPALPVPGGGVRVDNAPYWSTCYGNDTVFLIGGSLYQQSNLEDASKRLIDSLAAAAASNPPSASANDRSPR